MYLGVPGAQAWQLQAASVALAPAQLVEPLGRLVETAWSAFRGDRPAAPARALDGAPAPAALARVLDQDGAVLADVRLEGPDPYDFTAAILAWGAMRAADGRLQRSGTLGPVEAFGIDALRAGADQAGMKPI